jgi:hypothetical protein
VQAFDKGNAVDSSPYPLPLTRGEEKGEGLRIKPRDNGVEAVFQSGLNAPCP